jgi:hypothetical protein
MCAKSKTEQEILFGVVLRCWGGLGEVVEKKESEEEQKVLQANQVLHNGRQASETYN